MGEVERNLTRIVFWDLDSPAERMQRLLASISVDDN